MEIKEYVLNRKQELKKEVDTLPIKPHLVIIQVNDDEASNSYIRGKLKDSAEIGVRATLIKLSPSITEEELITIINKQNNDKDVNGLIVQMPLPKQINEQRIKLAVSPNKDVDGFHPLSTLSPCTPKGIITYLKAVGFNFVGKNAVVIGRSNIVGRPMAKLLINESANVTVLHSKTSRSDMDFYIKHADLIVVAVGHKSFLDNSREYRKDAIIVDVGINRIDGKLYGDAEANLPVKLQTPVPGGVGLLTRITLIENLLEVYKNAI
jgi:methylenetetrahydrofolate dehydrogenase (NADP+)/methenyltetrahydrofolate cyclohydrolase